jgi:hypothetical protein
MQYAYGWNEPDINGNPGEPPRGAVAKMGPRTPPRAGRPAARIKRLARPRASPLDARAAPPPTPADGPYERLNSTPANQVAINEIGSAPADD